VVFTATEAIPTAPDVTPNISAILIGAGLRCVVVVVYSYCVHSY